MKEYIEHLQGLSKSQLVLLLAQKKLAEHEPVAIVGNACRLPGDVNNLADVYNTLMHGKNTVETFDQGPPGFDGNAKS